MTVRRLSMAVAAVLVIWDAGFVGLANVGLAHAAPDEGPASYRSDAAAPSVEARVAAYRAYAKAQADTLAGMTKVLAAEIRSGDFAAARDDYAASHRYYARIVPFVRTLPDFDKRIDAQADAFGGKEADPAFSGFHKIEHVLFTDGSTANLSAVADRLDTDARDLRQRLAATVPTPAALLDGAVGTLREIADDSLTGDGERYSKTDLWDIEAKVDGARQIVDMLQPQLRARDNAILVSTAAHFAAFDAALEKHKEGCGFKTYDTVGRDDRRTLEAPITALAAELATLRGTLAMN